MSQQWIIIMNAVLGVFSVIGVGAILRQYRLITAEADASLLRLVVRVLLPCLIFDNVLQSNAFRDAEGHILLGNILLPPVVGYATVAVGILLGWIFARTAMRSIGANPLAYGTFAACVGIFNYGFVPIPLVQRLFPDGTLGVLFVYTQGVDLAIWTIGLLFISGAIERSWWRQMVNVPSVTIVLALTFNLLNLGPWLPSFARAAIGWLGEAAIPMSMVLVGATITEQIRNGESSLRRSTLLTSIGSCIVRLGLLPPLFILAAWLLPASIELKRVMVIQAAMPSAVFPIVMARHFGGDPATALPTVVSNSLVSLLTTPLWIVWGMRVVGGGLP